MHFWTGRPIRVFALIVAICTVAIITFLIRNKKSGNADPVLTRTPATFVDESLGFRVALPLPWIVLSASESAIMTAEGKTALAESGHDSNKLGVEHPAGKTRLLTAMNPRTGDSFQILQQGEPPSIDESRPEAIANDLRSSFLSLLPMQPLGPIERLDTSKPIAHFNGILTVKGSPIYQSVFVAVTKSTAITFVFSGPAESVLTQSRRSFPEWISFDHSAVR
jgi:hypothetical protein